MVLMIVIKWMNLAVWFLCAAIISVAIITAVLYKIGIGIAIIWFVWILIALTFFGTMFWLERYTAFYYLSLIATLLTTVIIVALSFTVRSEKGYAILTSKTGYTRVIYGTKIIVPYLYNRPIEYTDDKLKINTTANLILNDGREIIWKVDVELSLDANYDKVFSFIVKYGSKDKWLSEIEVMIKKAAQDYIFSNFKNADVFPEEFQLALAQEEVEKIANLVGYRIKDAKAYDISIKSP